MHGPADGGTHHPSASLHQQTSLSNDGCAVPVRAVELRIHGASGLSGASGRVIAVVRAQTRPQAGPTLLARIGSTIGHGGGSGGGRHASTRSGTTDGGGGEGAAMFEELAVSGEAALQHGRVVLGAWARIPTDAACLEISVRLLRSLQLPFMAFHPRIQVRQIRKAHIHSIYVSVKQATLVLGRVVQVVKVKAGLFGSLARQPRQTLGTARLDLSQGTPADGTHRCSLNLHDISLLIMEVDHAGAPCGIAASGQHCIQHCTRCYRCNRPRCVCPASLHTGQLHI